MNSSTPKPNTRTGSAVNAGTVPHLDHADRKARYAITIGKEPEEIFTFWRNFENLATFMKDVSSIETLSAKESKWTVTLKSGLSTEWNAVITEEVPGKKISWKSVEGSSVETQGTVWFSKAPQDLGTVVELEMDYSIPGGKLAEIATLFTGESPKVLINTNLKRLKQILETGEVATTEGQPSGREPLLH